MPAKTVSRGLGLALAVAALVGAPLTAGSAAATEGSVPSVVAAYAADPDGLLARLDDLFGVGANGKGLDFGDDTTVGELDRVFVWRADFLAGATGSTPIKRINEWTATITIADKPVGVATIWINPTGDEPDLADFAEGASLGAAFADIPPEAALVHDTAHSAWFTLTDDALAPIVTGTSGVASAMTLAAYQKRLVAEAARPAVVPAPTNQGAINSIIVVGVALLVVAALVILAGRRTRRTVDAAADAPTPGTATPPPAAPATAAPATKTITSPAKTPRAPAGKKPAPKTSGKKPAPKAPVSKKPAPKKPANPRKPTSG